VKYINFSTWSDCAHAAIDEVRGSSRWGNSYRLTIESFHTGTIEDEGKGSSRWGNSYRLNRELSYWNN
jgi:hypothetical protein